MATESGLFWKPPKISDNIQDVLDMAGNRVLSNNYVRWFAALPEAVRYQFSSQWMFDETKGISIAKLAACIPGEKSDSEPLVKSFRSFDLENNKLKGVWRPKEGFSFDDVQRVCCAVNEYRRKNGREDIISADDFYQLAWDTLADNHEPEPETQPETQPENRSIPWPMFAAAASITVALLLARWFVPNDSPSLLSTISPSDQHYLPGNVLQTRQLNKSNQTVYLDKPIHHLAAKTCYPQLTPQTHHSAISNETQLKNQPLTDLDSQVMLLPDLSATAHLLKSHQIKFANVSKLEISKGLLNLGISEDCLASLQNTLDYGNKVGFYEIIKQVFVADSVTYELEYHPSVDSTTITGVSNTIHDYFAERFAPKRVLYSDIESNSADQLTIKGPVVIAYISQQMSASM
ncbi:MAG: hypothetical protein ACI8WB_004804 [Phenylobacterium sp.]